MVVALTMPGPRTTDPTPAASAARRRGWWAILLAVLGIAAVMLLRPLASPPLYDGVGFPDEPYRWVQPPAGAPKTPAVTVARAEAVVELDGTVPILKGLSAEQGAQIAFQIGSGDLVLPQGAKKITAQAVAGPNASVPPPVGVLASNLYTLSVSTDVPGELALAAGKKVIVNIRADKASDDPVVLQVFSEGTWSQVATARVGTEIYAAEVPELGQFALVRLPPGVQPTVTPTGPGRAGGGFQTASDAQLRQDSNAGGSLLYVGGGGLVVLLLLGLFIARKRMSG